MTYSDTGSSKTETSKAERLLTGEPLPSLLLSSLPIICGNIFLQLYNIVDAIVVGRYLGSLSLAGISVAAGGGHFPESGQRQLRQSEKVLLQLPCFGDQPQHSDWKYLRAHT